jgi:hypothetical protein
MNCPASPTGEHIPGAPSLKIGPLGAHDYAFVCCCCEQELDPITRDRRLPEPALEKGEK